MEILIYWTWTHVYTQIPSKTIVKVLNMSVVATYTHRRKTSMATKFFNWCPDSKKISCALLYLFI
jgi:hypothetical protein